jgi:hypothetical protein
MPSTFKQIQKNCEICGVELKLNCSRDIERKKFCSKTCRSKSSITNLWKDESFKYKFLKGAKTKTHKKGHPGNLHPFFGKKRSDNSKLKQSISLSKTIMSGKFNPLGNHKSGYMYHEKFESTIFYRSSYEKFFLELCIEDETVTNVKSSPFMIRYENSRHYIPDFLITKNEKLFLIEVKPLRLIESVSKKTDAAIKFCEERNITFQFFTEKNITSKKI